MTCALKIYPIFKITVQCNTLLATRFVNLVLYNRIMFKSLLKDREPQIIHNYYSLIYDFGFKNFKSTFI